MKLRRVLRALLDWILPLSLIGCATVPKTGPCSSAQLAGISARYLAAVSASCDHHRPLTECAAYEPLRKQHEAELQVWQSCSTN